MTSRCPLTREEAKERRIRGWNLRCNHCGSYGATWHPDMRPGWGALALCPGHSEELGREQARHATEMERLTQVNFEQDH